MMTSDTELLKQIAEESTGTDSGDLDYGTAGNGGQLREYPAKYKVWNRDPANTYCFGEPPEGSGMTKLTPGIAMITSTGTTKENRVRHTELVEKVRAVVLFKTEARKLATGSGKFHRTLCQSHDGVRPSLRIEQPFCRKASASDVAQVFGQWKNYDKAKIDGAVEKVTDGTEQLQMCAMKAANGTISLCPQARRDPITGKAGPCKPSIYLHCYDIDRKREFTLDLGGKSIWHSDFIAPVHEFFKFLHTSAPKVKGQPHKRLDCYAFTVELTSAVDGAYYYLKVKKWTPIVNAENRADMRARALKAKKSYERMASWVPTKQLPQGSPGQASPPNTPVAVTQEKNPFDAPVTPTLIQPPAPVVAAVPLVAPEVVVTREQREEVVSFEEDDIPF